MNAFNSRIKISYQGQLEESDEDGNPLNGWVDRIESIPAKREVIKGSLKEIATREENLMYYKWTVWAGSTTRAILSTDRLTDLTSSNRVHSIISAYESDDRREIIILTKSADNQAIYNVG